MSICRFTVEVAIDTPWEPVVESSSSPPHVSASVGGESIPIYNIGPPGQRGKHTQELVSEPPLMGRLESLDVAVGENGGLLGPRDASFNARLRPRYRALIVA